MPMDGMMGYSPSDVYQAALPSRNSSTTAAIAIPHLGLPAIFGQKETGRKSQFSMLDVFMGMIGGLHHQIWVLVYPLVNIQKAIENGH